MQVIVKPLPLEKFHKKVGKEAFSQPKTVEALYDVNTGKYQTGLTEAETKEYSRILGVDLSDTFNPNEAHPYWSSKASWVYLPNQTLVLETTKPHDFVKVKLMKASPKVANTYADWENDLYPDATHYIYDETEEIELKASKIEAKNEARNKAYSMPMAQKKAMVQILSKKTVKNQSDKFINVEIDALIEDNAREFIRVADMPKEDIVIRSNIYELEAKNVLTKENGAYYYMAEMLGVDFDDMVNWFKKPDNNRLRVLILEKLSNTK